MPTARSYTVTKRELRTPDANTTLTSPWTYFQDRSNFTVYDGGSAGTAGWRSFQYDDGESIYLPDASLDKAVLSFQVPRSGYYRINIRQRSGSSADNASLWYPNHQYVYKLDNGPVALAGDINTIYSTPDDWDYIWGIARSGSVYLMAGTNHTLEVSCNSGWSGIDWVSIKDEAGVDWVTTNLSCSRSGNSITINNNFKASTLSVITVHPIPPAGMGWVKNDFDGDGKADPTVVYTNSSDQLVWCTLRSMLNFNAFVYHTWGGLTFSDFPLSGDYDGDGITDLMIYRPISNASEWHGSYSASGFPPKVLGASYDKPLSMDSDGDGKTDMRIYRPWDPAQWHGLTSSSGFNNWFPVTYYGGSADIPVPGDYDGDGIMDYAYCNSTSNGLVWNITFSSNGTSIQRLFGRLSYNDKPFAADFDGDGKSDIALYRPWYPAEWHCMTSSSNFSNYLPVQYYGYPIDIPTPGDYDGDGKADISVYRPATGEWYFKTSSNGWELKYVFPQPGGSPVGH